MSKHRILNRNISKSELNSHTDSHRTEMLLANQNRHIAYHFDLGAATNPAVAPTGLPMAYDTAPHQIFYDEANRPYIHRGETEQGVWRQYIVDNQCVEPTLWTYQPQELAGYELKSNHSPYLSSQALGRKVMLPSSNCTSVRNTPRSTPELDPAHVDFRIATPARKKRMAKQKDKPKRAALEKPLSELTKHLTHIPVKDMGSWVTRSAETRRSERKSDGSIKRPSNSFMLYRSAYTERCRELEKSSNHQDISSIAGSSWKIENPQVKKQFEDWAKLERENHSRAFPDYKFQPQTSSVKDRKRKHTDDDASDNESEDGDSTYRQGGRNGQSATKSTRSKKTRAPYRDLSGSPNFTSSDEVNTPEPYMSFEGQSSYFPSTNGKPMPNALDRYNQPGGYYVTSHPADAAYSDFSAYDSPGSNDGASFNGLDGQGMEYASLPPPMGMPGNGHNDLFDGLQLEEGQMMLGDNSFLSSDLDTHQQALEGFEDTSTARSIGFNESDYLGDGENGHFLSTFARDGSF